MPLENFVDRLRASTGLSKEVPAFDPLGGDVNAKYLLVLEAPGPKAVQSGYVSLRNEDPTARNLREQLAEAKIAINDVLLWNTVPWYLGNAEVTKIKRATQDEIEAGVVWLKELIAELRHLDSIVLVGSVARKAHVLLSISVRQRLLSCHHTSAQSMNQSSSRYQENVAVFKNMVGM